MVHLLRTFSPTPHPLHTTSSASLPPIRNLIIHPCITPTEYSINSTIIKGMVAGGIIPEGAVEVEEAGDKGGLPPLITHPMHNTEINITE